MDPEKLNSIYSRIICSSAITRQNLSRKPLIQPMREENKINNDEDDTHFFETLKSKIKSSPLNRSLRAKYESKKLYGTRKRKHKFIEESKNAINRFKEDMENKNQIELDTIKSHSKEKEICIDNSAFSNYNNDVLKTVNTNVDNNESYALKREFTLIFQTDKVSANKQDEAIFIKPNNIYI
ncbi:hypothetical protein M0802_012346 [Mischocyttarus mexicanus]|nr:hypothetical protein M0802_012346 [Mischocyttarus mexicanus]